MARRCDCHDLLEADCIRTQAAEDTIAREERREADRRRRLLELPGVIEASYNGECARCGEFYPAGTPILRCPTGWLAACCAWLVARRDCW